MRTGMNDTVHVQVQIVELLAVGVGLSGVNGDNSAIVHGHGSVLDDWGDDLRVLVGKPSEGRGDTHLVDSSRGVLPRPRISRPVLMLNGQFLLRPRRRDTRTV